MPEPSIVHALIPGSDGGPDRLIPCIDMPQDAVDYAPLLGKTIVRVDYSDQEQGGTRYCLAITCDDGTMLTLSTDWPGVHVSVGVPGPGEIHAG